MEKKHIYGTKNIHAGRPASAKAKKQETAQIVWVTENNCLRYQSL